MFTTSWFRLFIGELVKLHNIIWNQRLIHSMFMSIFFNFLKDRNWKSALVMSFKKIGSQHQQNSAYFLLSENSPIHTRRDLVHEPELSQGDCPKWFTSWMINNLTEGLQMNMPKKIKPLDLMLNLLQTMETRHWPRRTSTCCCCHPQRTRLLQIHSGDLQPVGAASGGRRFEAVVAGGHAGGVAGSVLRAIRQRGRAMVHQDDERHSR
jgi:hypothetical protein